LPLFSEQKAKHGQHLWTSYFTKVTCVLHSDGFCGSDNFTDPVSASGTGKFT